MSAFWMHRIASGRLVLMRSSWRRQDALRFARVFFREGNWSGRKELNFQPPAWTVPAGRVPPALYRVELLPRSGEIRHPGTRLLFLPVTSQAGGPRRLSPYFAGQRAL